MTNFNHSCNIVFVVGSAMLFSSCGGSGGGAASAETNSTGLVAFGTPYQCVESNALAVAQNTQPVQALTWNWQSNPSYNWGNPSTIETWSLPIDGRDYSINVRIVKPSSTATNGVVMILHGHSAAYSTFTMAALDDQMWNVYWANRGYYVIHIARRGNFGSSGDRLYDLIQSGLLAKYQNGQVAYSDLSFASWKYQADSVVAALTYMSTLPKFQTALQSIILAGWSGGAPTSLHVTYGSSVFKSAKNTAVLRFTGQDSAFDSNPDAAPGEYQYLTGIGKDNIPTIWIGGDIDTTTSKGKLACEFAAWNSTALTGSKLYLIPSSNHFGSWEPLSDQLQPILLDYLKSRGFAGL